MLVKHIFSVRSYQLFVCVSHLGLGFLPVRRHIMRVVSHVQRHRVELPNGRVPWWVMCLVIGLQGLAYVWEWGI